MRNKIGILLMAGVSLLGQESTAPGWQEFSIGPPTRNHSAFSREGIRAEGVPLKRVIARAYGLAEHRVIGPDWLDTERYALTAIASDPQDFQPLLQKELASRVHMAAQRETKEIAVYLLRPLEGMAPSPPPAQTQAKTGRPTPSIRMSHITMAAFAKEFADVIHKPVFDETGIDGSFDISFTWANNSPSSLQKAVKEQLGLQLVEDKRSVEILTIQHIEKLQFPK